MHSQQSDSQGRALTCGAQRDTAARQQAAAAAVVVGLRGGIGIAISGSIGLVVRLVDVAGRRGRRGGRDGGCMGSVALNGLAFHMSDEALQSAQGSLHVEI